jgi:hypothetical protein
MIREDGTSPRRSHPTEIVKLHGDKGMETDIRTADNGRVAEAFPYGPVGVFQGVEARAAGRVDGVARPGHPEPVGNPIGEHGARTAGDTEAVILCPSRKKSG